MNSADVPRSTDENKAVLERDAAHDLRVHGTELSTYGLNQIAKLLLELGHPAAADK